MKGIAVAATIAFLAAAVPAWAANLCILVTSGSFAGASVVVNGVKLTAGKFSRVQGYLAEYTGSYEYFSPLYGTALVGSGGRLILGLSNQDANIAASGSFTAGATPFSNNISCSAGVDGKFNELDACEAHIRGSSGATAHVVSCKDAPPLP